MLLIFGSHADCIGAAATMHKFWVSRTNNRVYDEQHMDVNVLFSVKGFPAISPNIANCIVVILTYYCYHSTSRGWSIVGDVALIFSHQSPSHCQCMVVGGCHCIGQYLRSDTVGAVITDHCPIPPPEDSSGRTTSGGAVESECWSSGIQL